MNKRQIITNAIMSVMQVLVISGTLFILYKFLISTIGVEQLGIWSLVLATTSTAQIANLGLSAGVVKFVAKYIACKENEKVSMTIQTAALSAAFFVGILLVIGFSLIKWVLILIIPNQSLPLALGILPWAFFALWIMIITSIIQAGLDGLQRIDIRSYILVSGAIIHLLLCFMLTPRYGLLGLAYARVIENFTILLSSWLLLKRYLPNLPPFPYKWDKGLFKEIFSYGIKFQVISISSMFYDPITKGLLSKFGGLFMVGYYEMASRMLTQIRSCLMTANQVIVPVIANLQEKIPEKIKRVYLTSYQLLFSLALPLFSFIIICSPLISELWIGYYEKHFVVFVVLLSIGHFSNILAGPAYFVNLGIGNLRWNILGYISIALLNIGLGILLGIFYDGMGVVIAWIISLAIGSSVIYISYHITYKIPLVELLPKASRILILVSIISILVILAIHHNTAINKITLLLFPLIIFLAFWFHPMRKYLAGWITNEFLNKESRPSKV